MKIKTIRNLTILGLVGSLALSGISAPEAHAASSGSSTSSGSSGSSDQGSSNLGTIALSTTSGIGSSVLTLAAIPVLTSSVGGTLITVNLYNTLRNYLPGLPALPGSS
ncbi:MAG: hypothetical protein Q3972_02135 [Corynebacterium sp.]|nr:hypothetical protein [Corynebacterium sp.]